MKRKHLIIGLMLFLMTSPGLFAQVVEGGTKTITAMRVDGGGVSIRLSPAPTNCNGGAQYRMHARVNATHPDYQAMVSSLLALKTSNKPIKYLWFNNSNITCDPTNILIINIIEY